MVEPGRSQGKPAMTTPSPPLPTDIEHIEPQILPVGLPVPIEPPPGSADPDNPEQNEVDGQLPLGVKLTGYRSLNLAVLLAFGLSKFILSLRGQSVAPNALDWVAGTVLAVL
jgi:hypothetical protein